MNIPNGLTLGRIILIPIFVIVFYLPFHWAHLMAAIIFALAAITDWLDGMLARYLNQISPLGTFLDPVADKLIVTTALVLLVGEPYLKFIAIPAAVIVGREIVISALREWMSEVGKRASVAVSVIGKVKTIVQMVALVTLVLYTKNGPTWILILGYIFLYTAAILTLWSMILYLKAAWADLTLQSK
ncbi:MAG: CDP-diacylglycerol--glycerol-3-phosphate 3-phosphatidyltransferase [Legionellales bacterium]|nr:CDP-diacylglycerol--glycerol-3-phosphate 3-phosphatidyltransferase [Legionellales bacterium]